MYEIKKQLLEKYLGNKIVQYDRGISKKQN